MTEFSHGQHPITPPPELVMQWVSLACDSEGPETWIDLATQAACWGADQELKACCMWLSREVCDGWGLRQQLRAARRTKPPSLKAQALDELQLSVGRGYLKKEGADAIRRALEALPD